MHHTLKVLRLSFFSLASLSPYLSHSVFRQAQKTFYAVVMPPSTASALSTLLLLCHNFFVVNYASASSTPLLPPSPYAGQGQSRTRLKTSCGSEKLSPFNNFDNRLNLRRLPLPLPPFPPTLACRDVTPLCINCKTQRTVRTVHELAYYGTFGQSTPTRDTGQVHKLRPRHGRQPLHPFKSMAKN